MVLSRQELTLGPVMKLIIETRNTFNLLFKVRSNTPYLPLHFLRASSAEPRQVSIITREAYQQPGSLDIRTPAPHLNLYSDKASM